MDYQLLLYFLAVVDHRTMTAAAQELGISQPALSHAIRRLETELEVQLFLRVGRGLRLTSAGEAVVGPARQAMRQLEHVRVAASDVTGLRHGHLNLLALPGIIGPAFTSTISDFRRTHPGVTVNISTHEDVGDIEKAVGTGQADFGVTEASGTDNGLTTLDLEQQEYIACFSLRNPPSQEGAISIEELSEFPLIAPPPEAFGRRLLDGAFAAAGVLPRIAVETDVPDVIIMLVVLGAGVAILPALMSGAVRPIRLRARPLDPPLVRNTRLVFAPELMSPAANAFLKLYQYRSPGGSMAR
jgi:LysR family carnitine catabolism transcriptional activator